MRRGDLDDLLHAAIVQRYVVHGGEEAKASQSQFAYRSARSIGSVARGRIQHEEADEACRVTRNRCDRRFVAGHAGDERRTCDVVRVELAYPSVSECLGRAGIVPLQFAAELRHAVAATALSRECGEERCGEEVAMCVVTHTVVSDSTIRP